MSKQLSKKDVKEVFIETLEPFAKAVQSDFKKVNERLDKVEFELNEVRTDVKEMKESAGELFTKLDRFIALYEKQEQELLIFNAQLRRLEERVNKLENEKHVYKR